MTLRRLDTWAEIDAATGHAPLVVHEIPHDFDGPGWGLDDAVAIMRLTHTGRRGLTFLGPDEDVLRLLARLRDEGLLTDVGSLGIEQSAFARAATLVPLGEGNDWEWMCAVAAPPAVAGENRVVALHETDVHDIKALLAEANPRTDARPFETGGQRWAGVVDDAGLLAIGCMELNRAGRPVLTGITVHPEARGQGLGLAVTAVLTRWALEESDVCTLGMYSDNAVGRRLYVGLGYRVEHRFSSRRLLG